jgi:hypothetical protein
MSCLRSDYLDGEARGQSEAAEFADPATPASRRIEILRYARRCQRNAPWADAYERGYAAGFSDP